MTFTLMSESLVINVDVEVTLLCVLMLNIMAKYKTKTTNL